MSGVPASVLTAFGVEGASVELLSGGLGPAYRARGLVLKEVEDQAEACFAAEVTSALEVDDTRLRLARPVRSASGDWVADGWTATRWVAGRHVDGPHPWSLALSAIDALGAGLSSVSVPVPSRRRTHRWAVADRVAWDEETVDLHPRISSLCGRLREITRSCDSPVQIIHGNVAGNLLFEPGLPPAVIDFSPYVRPAQFSLAVYIVDAIGWHGAESDLLRLVPADPALSACLPRAAIFRLVALDGYRREDGADIAEHLPAYERICDIVSDAVQRDG